jgi:hypothetical protein
MMFQIPSIELMARAKVMEMEQTRNAIIAHQSKKLVEPKIRILRLDIRIVLQPKFSVAITTGKMFQ